MARLTTAARRYAEAAYELAGRDNTVDAWAEGLSLAARLTDDHAVQAILNSPARPLRERQDLIGRLLGGRAPDGAIRLVTLLAERRRVDILPQVASEYRRLLDRDRGIVEARVTSAAPLTPDETDKVRAWVAKTTGKTVTLIANIDESLIGGLTVRVGDTLLDASVRGRLERLRNELLAGVRTA
jgi:F-type H+-transporting ATPase subunit delta